MSHSSFDSEFTRHHAAHGEFARNGFADHLSRKSLEPDTPLDDAIDTALRCVPLPDGLLTRLDAFVRVMPDESADQVDWLGC